MEILLLLPNELVNHTLTFYKYNTLLSSYFALKSGKYIRHGGRLVVHGKWRCYNKTVYFDKGIINYVNYDNTMSSMDYSIYRGEHLAERGIAEILCNYFRFIDLPKLRLRMHIIIKKKYNRTWKDDDIKIIINDNVTHYSDIEYSIRERSLIDKNRFNYYREPYLCEMYVNDVIDCINEFKDKDDTLFIIDGSYANHVKVQALYHLNRLKYDRLI